MEIIQHSANLKIWRENARKHNLSVGFVPTMGALHDGHLALVQQARSQNDLVICSIFVNPTQFNVQSDLERYPRKPEQDAALLKSAGCDVVFLPEAKEMYPEEIDKPTINFGNLTQVLEADFRPGHFEGVVQVVGIFFDLVQPTRAYFGEKDFQQLAIITAFAKQDHPDLEVVPCKIIRDENGLALSSRNELLSEYNKTRALFLNQQLMLANQLKATMTPAEVKMHIEQLYAREEDIELEYFEIRNAKTFDLPVDWSQETVALVAAYIGGVRLIDNYRLDPIRKIEPNSASVHDQIG